MTIVVPDWYLLFTVIVWTVIALIALGFGIHRLVKPAFIDTFGAVGMTLCLLALVFLLGVAALDLFFWK